MRHLIAAALLACLVLAPARGQDLYKAERGPYTVEDRRANWHDEDRQRDVPVKIYTPKAPAADDSPADAKPAPALSAGPFPLVVFSHGLGGSRENYVYFGEHLASHGYVVIHPQHAGSDTPAVLKRRRENPQRGFLDELAEEVSDPDSLRNRPRDISFVIDRALKDPALAKLIDPERIAAAGHSFGSYTTLAVGGMKVQVPREGEGGDKYPETLSFKDPRVKALIAMSPQGSGTMGVKPGAWDPIAVPTLFLTGTRDMGTGGRAAAWRREAFDAVRGIDAYLVVLNDATHMTFSGRMGPVAREREKSYIREIDAGCTAFLDAYLKGAPDARAWLKESLSKSLSGEATVESKTGPSSAPAPQGR